jgi:hypothetical protein
MKYRDKLKDKLTEFINRRYQLNKQYKEWRS